MDQENSKRPVSDRPELRGPAGRLEALLETPASGSVNGAVIVLHPHPRHGGTMHNKVVHTVARVFLHRGFASLRFNFRGTEGSEGSYDGGEGELADALAAAGWMRARHPGLPFWLAGFSFGAAIAIRAAVAGGADGLVSVAPAVRRFGGPLDRQPDCPWLVVQGDVDELVPVDETVEWINALAPGPELIVLEGAEHFFHGRLVDLREAVAGFVGEHA